MDLDGVVLPRYRCIKEVWAIRIIGIEQQDVRTLLQFEGAHLFYAVDNEWIERHDPQIGGYLVIYKDGYQSYSPAKAFEEGYIQA